MPVPRLVHSLLVFTSMAALASSCTVLFDYGEDSATGGGSSMGGAGGSGATASTGGGGSAADCADATECDDANDCTTDTCTAGSCGNEALADGAGCTSSGGEAGVCDGGTCTVACTEVNPSVCDDDNVCTVDSCDLAVGQCVNEPVANGPAEANLQVDGDCQNVVCQDGLTASENEDSDTPTDGNACTDDVCTSGAPSNPDLAQGTNCGGALVCDGAGICVGCNQASDCPGQSSFCVTITCTTQQCGADNTTDGTPLPPAEQTAGACKEVQCNGMGGTKIANQNTGSSCDDTLYCNGTDSCLSGNCSQHSGDPCTGPDNDSDCSESCNESTDACTANDANGTVCDDGLYCTGSDTCSNGNCSQHSGDPCTGADGDSNCSESCSEQDNACNAPDPTGSACNDGLYCNGNDSCTSGGTCGLHNGNPCPGADNDGDCTESCNEANNNCTAKDPEGSGCFNGGVFGCCFNGNCFDNCP
jgi:hypothetical protein